MPEIRYTEAIAKDLKSFQTPADRARMEVAFLLGEAQWRRVALGDADLIRKEESDQEMTTEEVEEMIAYFEAIANGREPARVSDIRWEGEEKDQVELILSGATEEERSQRLLNLEIQALIQVAEERAITYQVEKVTSARQYDSESIEALREMLGKFSEGGIGHDVIQSIEDAILDASGPNRAMLLTDGSRQILRSAPDVEGLAAIDLDEGVAHRIDAAASDYQELTGKAFSANCGVELQDIGDTENGRIMQLTMLTSTAKDLAPCEKCMPDRAGEGLKVGPPR
jgi:hypothetical protein